MDLRKVSVLEAPEVYQRLAQGAVSDDPAQWIFSYDWGRSRDGWMEFDGFFQLSLEGRKIENDFLDFEGDLI